MGGGSIAGIPFASTPSFGYNEFLAGLGKISQYLFSILILDNCTRRNLESNILSPLAVFIAALSMLTPFGIVT